jgi:hypothetical protein
MPATRRLRRCKTATTATTTCDPRRGRRRQSPNVTGPAAGDANPADCVPPEANPPYNYPIVGFTTSTLRNATPNSTVGFDIMEYWVDFYTTAYMQNLLLQHGFSPLLSNLSTAMINNRFTQGATGNTDVMEPTCAAQPLPPAVAALSSVADLANHKSACV